MTSTSHEPGSNEDLRERPLGELLGQLAQETTTLFRQEIELAKAEMTEKARKAGVGAGLLTAAGATGLLAGGAASATVILALDHWMPAWLAALIVTLIWGALAAVFALQGRRKVQEAAPPVPEQTAETVKENVEWAKTQVRSEKR